MTWRNDQVTEPETERVLSVARECLATEGDFVELGCYKGDTSILLAELLVEKSVEKPVKKLWIYDSFEGLPMKGEEDASEVGKDFRQGELVATKREVKVRFLKTKILQ